MTKITTISFVLAILGGFHVNAQNVGIGIATPLAKTHVNQTAAVDGVLIDHSGAAGNSIEVNQSVAGNGSSATWIKNSGTNRAVFAEILNVASLASVVQTDNDGLGEGLFVNQLNTGASSNGILVSHFGTGAAARGVEVGINSAGNTAIGYSLFHTGEGRGSYMSLSNAANGSTGSAIYHAGLGRGTYYSLSNPANPATGNALFHAGTGWGTYIGMTNAASTGIGFYLGHDGLGRGGNISLSNTANTDIGWGIWNSGTGTGLYSETEGDAVFGFVNGTQGTGGTFIVNNTAADRNSIGLFVVYAGTGGGAAGGGNAAEIQHDGNNGNAVDVFLGDPSLAAGPANTTSEYSTLSASHYATGTSPTAGLSKTAGNFSNNSADPTVMVFNNGSNDGDGINVFVDPVLAANQAAGIYSQSSVAGGGAGIGVFGFGGDFGVVGSTSGGNNLGVFSNTDFAAVGTKAFLTDHPLDPENKTLRHFCIESNEVLNMYRGIIELDANGQAVVSLPDYFDEVNINPSYQLTPIGTGTQPYVASEISGNKFTVAGAPGTKVSWTVHAQRNDAVIRYFSSKIENYTSDVRNKRPSEVGKYYLPEAYSADKTKGILYNEGRDKNYREKDDFVKQQKANSSPEAKSAPYQNVKNVSDSKEKEEMSSPVRSNTDDDKLSNR